MAYNIYLYKYIFLFLYINIKMPTLKLIRTGITSG